jgi:putative ABC transport system ATP-binding protein
MDLDLVGTRAVPLLVLEGIWKTYRSSALAVDALRGVSLQVMPGEFVAIMGPSGSGKSTLMHIVGCLDVPSAGRYILGGEDVSRLDDAELAVVRNRQIGFVFQQFNLLASLDALHNVELPLLYTDVPRSERRRTALLALERVGLSERVSHRPGELSGGQQQRVAVARALVTEPSLILADEPTGSIDSRAAREVLDLLLDLHREGRTIVVITHDPEVAATAERIVRIRDGLIVGHEAPAYAGGPR